MIKLKSSFKPMMLIFLVTVFSVIAIMPTNVYAGGMHMPGNTINGPYGWTCSCPAFPWYDCGCFIKQPVD